MYEMMDAHPITVIVILSAFLVTPVYVLATYTFSGASKRKGLRVGAAWLVLGAWMFWVCVADIPQRLATSLSVMLRSNRAVRSLRPSSSFVGIVPEVLSPIGHCVPSGKPGPDRLSLGGRTTTSVFCVVFRSAADSLLCLWPPSFDVHTLKIAADGIPVKQDV